MKNKPLAEAPGRPRKSDMFHLKINIMNPGGLVQMIMNSFPNKGSDGCRLQPLIFQGVHASPEKKQRPWKKGMNGTWKKINFQVPS